MNVECMLNRSCINTDEINQVHCIGKVARMPHATITKLWDGEKDHSDKSAVPVYIYSTRGVHYGDT